MARTLARTLDMEFRRVQFTPDLMPADITGTDVMEEDQATGKHRVSFMQGPVFTNFLLADEINRTPPKTQAALLQAMQEGEVSVGRETYKLKPPFFVVATQNPIEMEGTYPLPEAQLDRFMFNLKVQYPTVDEEVQIIKGTTSKLDGQADTVLAADEVLRLQELVRGVPIADSVVRYTARLVAATRPGACQPDRRSDARRDPQVPGLRRQPAGLAVPGAGRQGPGDPGGQVSRRFRRHPGRAPPGPAASPGAQLPRPGRQRRCRRAGRTPAESRPGGGEHRLSRFSEWTLRLIAKHRTSPIRCSSRGSITSSCGPAALSKGSCTACTAARSWASASSSPRTANMPRATTCGT